MKRVAKQSCARSLGPLGCAISGSEMSVVDLSTDADQIKRMALVNEILAESNGAHFLRADLHIHSFGDQGSYDVKDAAMTSEGIVDAAIKENLQVVAIADHNAIGNIQRAVNYAKNKDVLVVPAIEVSTQQVTCLSTFQPLDVRSSSPRPISSADARALASPLWSERLFVGRVLFADYLPVDHLFVSGQRWCGLYRQGSCCLQFRC